LSSAAICDLKPEGSNLVILATPDLPWHSFRQDSSTPVAKGVTAPSPVITALLSVLLIFDQRLFSTSKKLLSCFCTPVSPVTGSERGISAYSSDSHLLDFCFDIVNCILNSL
jgi:hypothetical protein